MKEAEENVKQLEGGGSKADSPTRREQDITLVLGKRGECQVEAHLDPLGR